MTDLFIHFTSAGDAAAILAAGVLQLSRTIVNAVYAAPVGGSNVPSVQYAQAGAEVAILFSAPLAPDTVFPEEAIWHRDTPLPISEAIVVPAEEARLLLDGSAGIPDDGVHHDVACACAACDCRARTLFAA